MKSRSLFSFALTLCLLPVAVPTIAASSRRPAKKAPAAKALAWKTYTNTRYGYSIQYPAHWPVRPFPDTQNGAEFGSLKPMEGGVMVSYAEKPEAHRAIPLARYARIAAVQEIQGYERLASIQPVKAKTGQTGYLTTWRVWEIGEDRPKTSPPITYFESPNKRGTVQIYLLDPKKKAIYLQMIRTVSLTAKPASKKAGG